MQDWTGNSEGSGQVSKVYDTVDVPPHLMWPYFLHWYILRITVSRSHQGEVMKMAARFKPPGVVTPAGGAGYKVSSSASLSKYPISADGKDTGTFCSTLLRRRVSGNVLIIPRFLWIVDIYFWLRQEIKESQCIRLYYLSSETSFLKHPIFIISTLSALFLYLFS